MEQIRSKNVPTVKTGDSYRSIGYGKVRPLLLGCLLFATVAACAGDVFMLPPSNILWRTAPSSEFEVPVLLPPGASSAALLVTGHNYRREYTGIGDGEFRISLPAADSDDAENVYDLTLTFDDKAETTLHAKLAVVKGASSTETAEAYVRRADSSKWSRIPSRAVLPIPSGTDAISVNGQPEPLNPAETPGWYNFTAVPGLAYDLMLTDGGSSVAEASLFGFSSSFKLIIR